MSKTKQTGHPRFYELLKEEANLHSIKNEEYAEKEECLGNFNRVAHWVDYYNILNATISTRAKVNIIYTLKQIDCIFNAFGKGKKMKIEGNKERIQDISIYFKILTILLEEDEKKIKT